MDIKWEYSYKASPSISDISMDQGKTWYSYEASIVITGISTPPIPQSARRVSTECCPPNVSAECPLRRHSAGTQQALVEHSADTLDEHSLST